MKVELFSGIFVIYVLTEIMTVSLSANLFR